MISNKAQHDHGRLYLRTWQDAPDVHRFGARSPGFRRPPTEIVIHESAGASWQGCQRTLERKGKESGYAFGVHFMLDEHGNVSQHADTTDRLVHCPSHSQHSIALEVINPYTKVTGAWAQKIRAPWAHGKHYTLATPAQCEALWLLLGQLLPLVDAPLEFPALRADGRFALRSITETDKPAKPQPGVWAHHHTSGKGGHSDGAWPTYYCAVRARGLNPKEAYNWCRMHAFNQRRSAEMP